MSASNSSPVAGDAPAVVAELKIRYPAELPITERHDELLATIAAHQVVIVAGETGSGKSTQLPKLCLELGRGIDRLIGHTQPRRVAARTIAARVAEELGVKLGAEVGYSVRFDDRVDASTRVRVMTDGVLLAELQRDRMLKRYDTIIIDEAHERSLNIDFLLGYLRQLLPKRRDLKVIITSATIDTERFARHFATNGVDAPVVTVTGRTFPVEVRYRPFGAREPETADGGVGPQPRPQPASTKRAATTTKPKPAAPKRSDDRDQVQAIVDAVEELSGEGPGDVLVFLSGEREIHDTADAIRKLERPGLEVLPLYARLSASEQQRIFQPHPGRRVVLSTNVAETSITVPGVRYVVDTGTARISRYSRRLKVQRLPIEPISQASANQRAGRCGRVAPGICIRLYEQEDFDGRDEFTDPEILRTNLAAVILQMTAIGLGDVAGFPFVEPPERATIRDGELLLEELGALTAAQEDQRGRRLTEIGRRLARLPIDPRLGRMVLEADTLGCVREVMVIASALSIRDVRERPEEKRQIADEFHRRFNVPGSDLLTYVALWDHLRERQRELSSNQFRKLCRAEFLNYVRVREWQDLFSQLRRAAGEVGVRPGTEIAHPDHVHRAVLSGHLSHLGMFDPERRDYQGARGSRFVVAPGSVLSKATAPARGPAQGSGKGRDKSANKSPKWVMAAELVETDRLRARRVATIRPEWAEQLGAHLITRSYGEPWWEPDRAAAITAETVMLYGLPIVPARPVLYDRVDPGAARAMFIRYALVQGEWSTRHRFVEHNCQFVEQVRSLEDRARRTDLLDDDMLAAFYEARVPEHVTTGRRFDRWWDRTRRNQPELLDLTEDVLYADLGLGPEAYPDVWRQGSLELPLTYRFDPSSPLDGITVQLPLTALNQVTEDGFDWQVPGHRFELVSALIRSLPKSTRRLLIPAAETTEAAFDRLGAPDGRLVDALAAALTEVSGVKVRAEEFNLAAVPGYLRFMFVVADDQGKVLDASADLEALRRRLASTVRGAIAEAAPIQERRGILTWDLGTIPPVVEFGAGGGHVALGYPALLDEDTSVSLRVLTTADLQARVMRGGVRRLLLLTISPSVSKLVRGLDGAAGLALAGSGFEATDLAADAATAAVDRVMADHDLPWDPEAFSDLQRAVRDRAPGIAADALSAAVGIVAIAADVTERLDRMTAASLVDTVTDARRHLERIVGPRFVMVAGTRRLPDLARYVRGIAYRIDRLAGEIDRDHRRMSEVASLERRYARYLGTLNRGPVPAEVVQVGWQLEELRLSVFAQPLAVRSGVSPKRLAATLGALGA